jgi:hypothetical protein
VSPALEAVVNELKARGVPYRVEHGGKHLRVRFGQRFERFRIVSNTPSDWRAPLNERSAVRRALNEMGWTR